MSADSIARRLIASDQPLFRFGDPTERFESIGHTVLVIVAVFLMSPVLVGLGNGILETADAVTPVTSEIVPSALGYLAFILVAVSYLVWRREESLVGVRIPTLRDIAVAVVGSIMLIGTMLLGEVILSELGVTVAENAAVRSGRSNPEIFLYYIPVVIFFNSPAEELVFRGVIQGLFRRAYGVVPGILIAGGIFGLFHLPALVGQGSAMAYIIIAFLSGILLGAVYELTENILVPIAVHAVWNVLVYANLYVGTTGMV